MYHSSISPAVAAAILAVVCIFLSSALSIVLYLNRQKFSSLDRSDAGLQCDLPVEIEESQVKFARKSGDFIRFPSVDSDYSSCDEKDIFDEQEMDMNQTYDPDLEWDYQGYICDFLSIECKDYSNQILRLQNLVEERSSCIDKMNGALKESSLLELKDQRLSVNAFFPKDDKESSVETSFSDIEISSVRLSTPKQYK